MLLAEVKVHVDCRLYVVARAGGVVVLNRISFYLS